MAGAPGWGQVVWSGEGAWRCPLSLPLFLSPSVVGGSVWGRPVSGGVFLLPGLRRWSELRAGGRWCGRGLGPVWVLSLSRTLSFFLGVSEGRRWLWKAGVGWWPGPRRGVGFSAFVGARSGLAVGGGGGLWCCCVGSGRGIRRWVAVVLLRWLVPAGPEGGGGVRRWAPAVGGAWRWPLPFDRDGGCPAVADGVRRRSLGFGGGRGCSALAEWGMEGPVVGGRWRRSAPSGGSLVVGLGGPWWVRALCLTLSEMESGDPFLLVERLGLCPSPGVPHTRIRSRSGSRGGFLRWISAWFVVGWGLRGLAGLPSILVRGLPCLFDGCRLFFLMAWLGLGDDVLLVDLAGIGSERGFTSVSAMDGSWTSFLFDWSPGRQIRLLVGLRPLWPSCYCTGLIVLVVPALERFFVCFVVQVVPALVRAFWSL